MKKIIYLNLHKWRSGSGNKTKVGIGCTELLNFQGSMCCLGQWCRQAGIFRDSLEEEVDPKYLSESLPEYLNDRMFTKAAIIINDSPLSITEKLKKLTDLCSKNNRKLVITNDSAFRKNGSVNWDFIASMFYNNESFFQISYSYGFQSGGEVGLPKVVEWDNRVVNIPSSHEIEQVNKYTRQAIRHVGKDKFVRKVSKKIIEWNESGYE